MKIIIGSDHGGLDLKEFLKTRMIKNGHYVTDAGTNSKKSVDYPDFAGKVAESVVSGAFDRGIMIDAIGNASAITCNKIPGIRAAVAINEFTVKSSREHNNANILTLGGLLYAPEYAGQLVDVWLKTDYAGGRHQNRLNKIFSIEKKYSGSAVMQISESYIKSIVIRVLTELGYLKDEQNSSLRNETTVNLLPDIPISSVKTAGITVASSKSSSPVIVESIVIKAIKAGNHILTVPLNAIVTQLAVDTAKDNKLKIERRG